MKTNSFRTPIADQLLRILISDIESDVEVVARERGLRDEMLERLQRALDRVECAQSVLEAIGFRTHRGGDVTPDDTGVREAVALLARRWPKDYPTDAVEWMLLRRSRDVGATAVSRL